MRAAALAAILCAASLAVAAPADDLAAARGHWRDLDYDLVVAAAERALADGAASKPERIEALKLKGAALVVLGDRDGAVAAFEAMLALDPRAELPDGTSPRILSVFRPAREKWLVDEERRLAVELGEKLTSLAVEVRAPDQARGGRPIDVEVVLTDPGAVAGTIVVAYRRGGASGWSTLTAPAKDGATTLTIPGALTAADDAYALELAAEVRHATGFTLRRAAPRTVDVGAGRVPRATPIYRRWWFWATTAVVVAGGLFLLDQAIPVGGQTIEVRPP